MSMVLHQLVGKVIIRNILKEFVFCHVTREWLEAGEGEGDKSTISLGYGRYTEKGTKVQLAFMGLRTLYWEGTKSAICLGLVAFKDLMFWNNVVSAIMYNNLQHYEIKILHTTVNDI